MSQIGGSIEQLDKILRAPKGRGNMGEESLAEMLQQVFPPHMIRLQHRIDASKVVDAAVKTTAGILPIDAKYPLPAYESIMNAETDEQRVTAQKQFYSDVKKRVDEVHKYIDPSAGTTRFAVLYLPNEGMYYEAMIRGVVVPEHAKKKQVLVVSPGTLYYVLQIIMYAQQSQEYAKHAEKALRELDAVTGYAVKLESELGVLGKHIGNANTKLPDVMKASQKLQLQIKQVKQVGGADKKLVS